MSDRVEPPAEHRGVRWHWLAAENGELAVARWAAGSGGAWSVTGIWHQAKHMARGGWTYIAPCIPPEPPRG